MLKAGFSKVCISPAPGVPLAGFAARPEVSTGTHDDLFARALVFETAHSAVALVSVDLLALPAEFIARVRRLIQESTGLKPDSIMIASTHTHAGPVTIRTFFNPDGSVDRQYMNALADGIEEAVRNAWRERAPAKVGVGVGHVTGVGVNRRSPDQKPVDDQIGIVRVTDLAENTQAIFINYACHPTVLGPDNLLVTGDFPAFAVQALEQAIGPRGFAMFVNGTKGNISMGHSSELSAIGVVTPGRTFTRAEELGQLLANATLKTLSSINVDEDPLIAASILKASLPLKSYPDPTETLRLLREAEEKLNTLISNNGDNTDPIRRAKSDHLYASINDFYARETKAYADGMLPIELQGIRIKDALFVAVPAEVFVEIGLQLKQAAMHKLFIVGIANGYIGYLPTSEAYDVGGYEVVSSKCRPEAASKLIEQALNLEQKLFQATEAQQ
ncbi:MAG TPA: neutral/alkaline non-lysosomal ceramidase N-terminal domain-containing protein [Pyrinomonadaceae bacterium]